LEIDLPETLISILEAHFERFTKSFIDKVIEKWVDKKNAFLLLQSANNDNPREYENFLQNNYDAIKDTDQGIINSKVLCQQSSGDLKDDDPVFIDCHRLSDLTQSDLKAAIGQYFRKNTNSYLQEKSLEIKDSYKLDLNFYEEVEKEIHLQNFLTEERPTKSLSENAKESEIASDNNISPNNNLEVLEASQLTEKIQFFAK
jgi:hypothetical protein